MKYPGKSGSFKLGPWAKGLNNVKHEEDLDANELAEAENFIFNATGEAETRPGLIKRVDAFIASGLYKVSETIGVFFDAGKLYHLDVMTWEKTELASGFAVGKRTSWVTIGPRIFFTNGSQHGRIHVPTWEVLEGFGTSNPKFMTTLSSLGYGNLHPGRYFIAITYVDSFGQESGASGMSFIELESEGGISVSFSDTPDKIVRVYMTEAGGDRLELYRVDEINPAEGETSAQITTANFGSPISTLFLDEIPVPDLITAYNGYLFFAVGSMVWSSEAQNYGLYHIDHNEVGTYPENVSVLERGLDGIFAVADKTYAYLGKGPKDFELLDNVFNYPAAKFSGRQVEGKLFSIEGIQGKDVPFWFSSRGAVIGLPGGTVLPISKGKAEPDRYAVGASGTIEFNGIESVITAVDESSGPSDSIGLQDTFSVRVVNRGITE